jgi:hypothetical protein
MCLVAFSKFAQQKCLSFLRPTNSLIISHCKSPLYIYFFLVKELYIHKTVCVSSHTSLCISILERQCVCPLVHSVVS